MGVKLNQLIITMVDEQEILVKDFYTGEILVSGNVLDLKYALDDNISLRESEVDIMYSEQSEFSAFICFYVKQYTEEVKKMKLYEFIAVLMHQQEVVIIDYYNGKTYARGKARRVAYFLEFNETRLKDSKIQLIEVDINNATICIHVRKD